MSIKDVLSGLAPWHVACDDVLAWLPTVPDASVHCVVTSPPYYGLRSYLRKDDPSKSLEHGSEEKPEQYIARQVEVFRAVRRVLRPDGVLWINYGDSYTNSGKTGGHSGNKNAHSAAGGIARNAKRGSKTDGQEMLMPHRVALALQADGWRLRKTVIWSKPSPMPESVSGWEWRRCRVKVDQPHKAKWQPCPGCSKCEPNGGLVLRRGRWRPTTAHEYLFMMTPSERYFADAQAATEEVTGGAHSRGSGVNPKCVNGEQGVERQNGDFSAAVNELVQTRNPRSVWTISTESFKGKHFAAFPSDLPRRCIEASTSKAGCCPHCGSQWAPVVVNGKVLSTEDGLIANEHGQRLREGPYTDHNGTVFGNRDPQRHIQVSRVEGYRPTCTCPEHQPVPAVVLDPYAGSGQTIRAAVQLGRRGIGCELNIDYHPLIAQRVATPLPVKKRKKTVADYKAEVADLKKRLADATEQLTSPLFARMK